MKVGFHQGFGFLAGVGLHGPQTDDVADRGRDEAVQLGFGQDGAFVVRHGLFGRADGFHAVDDRRELFPADGVVAEGHGWVPFGVKGVFVASNSGASSGRVRRASAPGGMSKIRGRRLPQITGRRGPTPGLHHRNQA